MLKWRELPARESARHDRVLPAGGLVAATTLAQCAFMIEPPLVVDLALPRQPMTFAMRSPRRIIFKSVARGSLLMRSYHPVSDSRNSSCATMRSRTGPGGLGVVREERLAFAQRRDRGIELTALATLDDDANHLPGVLLGLEVVAAIAEGLRDVHQLPRHQLAQPDTDVRARDSEGVADLIRVQRLGTEEQQGVDLRLRAIDTPAGTHLAPVEDVTLHHRCKFHPNIP